MVDIQTMPKEGQERWIAEEGLRLTCHPSKHTEEGTARRPEKVATPTFILSNGSNGG